MKKNLLLMMLCCPIVLAAQNGVTVSGLAVDAGTVTFNVSWDKDAMPVALWSDTVWVFVDYNNAGKMERLPVTDATASAGTVTKIPNNDKGVWVVGDARTNTSFSATVQLLTVTANVAGACAYASNYPPVGKYNDDGTGILFTGTSMYKIVLEEITSGSTSTAYSDGLYTLPAGNAVQSFTDATGAPALMPGINQPQGSCTFTQPPVVGTFASFPNNYSASTYVTLTDTRDNKNYEVVKIGNRWIMARNLNYQKNLTWRANSASPSTGTGHNTALIGNFWCPGGANGNTATSSTLTSCDVWGALYSWETAMMPDGKGTWSEAATSTYNTGAANAAGSKINQGRTSSTGSTYGGRGICPTNWHVPTDNEWGIILDGMEDGTSTVHQNASSAAYYGTYAGTRGKSACMCVSEGCNDDTNVSWYYYATESARGTDVYGFRVLPTGRRNSDGSIFENHGKTAIFWSSSAASGTNAWRRSYYFSNATVNRTHYSRSYGFSVRCIRN
jgi:uncharacterized protein (TIGR02145 family)